MDAKPRLAPGEIAAMLDIPLSTAKRLLSDGSLRVIRERGWRKAYASQVAYVADALDACRPGSIEQFCREWLDKHPLPASVTEGIAS